MSDSLQPYWLTVHGILQARILEWVAFPFSRGSSQPRDRTQVSRIADGIFTSWVTRKAQELGGSTILLKLKHAKSLQSCLTLCDPMDCSLPASSVHGILQAWILVWVAISSCKVSSQPRDGNFVSYISCIGRWVLYHKPQPGKPLLTLTPSEPGKLSYFLFYPISGMRVLISYAEFF